MSLLVELSVYILTCRTWKCYVKKHKKLKPCKSAAHNSIPSSVIPSMLHARLVSLNQHIERLFVEHTKTIVEAVRELRWKSSKVFHEIYWILDTREIFSRWARVAFARWRFNARLSLFMGFHWHFIFIFCSRCRVDREWRFIASL